MNIMADDEDKDSSGEDEINHNRELLVYVIWMENENIRGSSPDSWTNDEGSTSQQANIDSNDTEGEGELPHGEYQMRNENIQGSPPDCFADDEISTSQKTSIEDNEKEKKPSLESDDNDRVVELPHGGNQRKRKLPVHDDDAENAISLGRENKKKLKLPFQSDEYNFIQGSSTGCSDNNEIFRSQQVSGEDSEREKKLPHKSGENEEMPHGNNESKEKPPPGENN